MEHFCYFAVVWAIIGLVSFVYYNHKLNQLPFTLHVTPFTKPWTYVRWAVCGMLIGPLMWAICNILYGIATSE